jgi:VanZ family protein
LEVRLALAMPDFFSYPSGHASLAFCAAVLLSLVCAQAKPRRALEWSGQHRRRRWVVPASLSGAALIALSRVYLGHHYPSDILGGAVLGAGLGALCFGLGLARGPRLRWGIWPQLALVLVITQLAYLGILPRGWDLGLPHADKLLHFLLFGLLGFWLHLWLRGRRVFGFPLAGVLVLGGAALEEAAQALSPSRSSDVVDLLCDAAGVVLLVWCADRILRGRARARAVLTSGPWKMETGRPSDPTSAGPG